MKETPPEANSRRRAARQRKAYENPNYSVPLPDSYLVGCFVVGDWAIVHEVPLKPVIREARAKQYDGQAGWASSTVQSAVSSFREWAPPASDPPADGTLPCILVRDRALVQVDRTKQVNLVERRRRVLGHAAYMANQMSQPFRLAVSHLQEWDGEDPTTRWVGYARRLDRKDATGRWQIYEDTIAEKSARHVVLW